MIDNENAIEVSNVSKYFRIYHERKTTLYDHLVSAVSRNKKYEQLKVLDNVSFSVKKGEMFGIIGRNGEGKTTLLRLLSRIFKPDKGSIDIHGSIVPFLELGSGFQPELTAIDNIVLYGILLGFTKKQIKQKIPAVLEYAELEKFADTKLKHFSSGMYARLAFSTAIQVDPDILMVDEVLSVGDVPFQEKSFKTFLDFKRKGKTIVFVTHSLAQITRLCDRAIFLNKGQIHSIGKPGEVVNDFYRIVEGRNVLPTEGVKNKGEIVSSIRRYEPHAIATNSITNRTYVTGISADIVSVIDNFSNKITKRIRVGAAPREIAINPFSNLIYIANRDSNSVSVIDGARNVVTKTIPVGEKPRGLAINENTNRLFVANRDSNSLSIINTEIGEVVAEIDLPAGPQGLAIDKLENTIYVANSPINSLCKIDGFKNKIIEKISVGSDPIYPVLDPTRNRILVSNRGSNTISIINLHDNHSNGEIQVGSGPFGLALDNLHNTMYIANSGSNTISKINLINNKVESTIDVSRFPLGISIDQRLGLVYVANHSDDSVSIVKGIGDMKMRVVNQIKIPAIIDSDFDN